MSLWTFFHECVVFFFLSLFSSFLVRNGFILYMLSQEAWHEWRFHIYTVCNLWEFLSPAVLPFLTIIVMVETISRERAVPLSMPPPTTWTGTFIFNQRYLFMQSDHTQTVVLWYGLTGLKQRKERMILLDGFFSLAYLEDVHCCSIPSGLYAPYFQRKSIT